MSTEITFKVTDEYMEYARSIWDSAEYVLSHVNKILTERGIDIKFDIDNCYDEEDWLEEYWNEEHPNYNGGIIIIDTPKKDDCSFMDDLIK